MEQTSQSKPKSVRRVLTGPLVFTLVACGIVYYLFGPVGPISGSLHVDLSFLLLPFLSYYILRLCSRLSGALIRPRTGAAIALILNGAAFSFFSYYFLSRVTLFTRIHFLAGALGFFSYLSHVALYGVLFFTGYTIVKLADLFKINFQGWPVYPVFLAAGQSLMGYCLWQSFAVFAASWPPASGIGLIFLVSMLAVAITNLGIYGIRVHNRIIADFSGWLKTRPAAKFFIGGLITAYFIFVRPALLSASPYAYLIEWLIICFAAWCIFSGTRGGLEKRYCSPLRESRWRRHVQKIDELTDEDFTKLSYIQEDFVERSRRKDLLTCIARILKYNGLGVDEIDRLLHPITEYRDRKVPWYIIWYWRRRIQKQNRDNRRQALNDTIDILETIAHPSQRKI